ncbi:MAG: DUF1566 domain-containing protein [Chitinophagales bacterium]
MKKLFFLTALLFSISAIAQTNMTIHLSNGTTETFSLSNIDSITYSNTAPPSYTVGDTGQAGIIFYDKGSYSNGWRYLEVYPDYMNQSLWGCSGQSISGTSDAIGTGQANTTAILNGCATPGIAARVVDNFFTNINGVNYDDWFLPSVEELNMLYLSYNSSQLNYSFLMNGNQSIWSSTQSSTSPSNSAWLISMTGGNYFEDFKSTNAYATLAVRKF